MDLIVAAFTDKWDDWERDGFPSRTGALTLALAEDPRVQHLLVVNVPSSVLSAGRAGSARQPFSMRRVRPNVSVIDHVRLLPRERHSPLALKLNAALHDRALSAFVRSAAEDLGMVRPVALHVGPLTTGLFGKLGEDLRVYDAVDEWVVHPAFARMAETIRRSYGRIREEADLVVAVSEPLSRLFEGGSAATAVVRNGVTRAFLSPRAVVTPDDLGGLPRPIVGYIGALEERVDAELLEHLAATMPEVTFLLVGPVSAPEHFRGLEGMPNVHFLGNRNHDVLADYVRSFDACMMPHRDTPLTRMMDPIKLHEYIASGRPVVMTAVGEWERLRGYVHVAHSHDEFRSHLHRVLTEEPGDARRAAEYARANSWAKRAEELLDLIDGLRSGGARGRAAPGG